MSPAVKTLARMRRGSSFLGCDVAIMGGAMTWVSERHLVAAISNAGGFGVLACGSMEPNRLTEEIGATRSLTDRPFGVNLILLHPALEALIDRCCDAGVGYIVLAGGLPNRAILERCKKNGAKVMAFAPTASAAKRLIRNGADGLIIEGAEAGGHIGPVATSVLAQEILPEIDEVPVFVAGGIGHGEAIAGYLSMGAAGVQLGTRFVSATECVAHPRFKETFIRAQARDAMPTVQLDPEFKVIPVRALVNQGTDAFHAKQREVIGQFRSGEMDYQTASLAIEHFWAGALRRAVIDGDVETGSLMAGQSVGFVKKEQPVREIIEELVAQTETALTRSAKP